ncbi:MAG: hypothetical protein HN333_08170, partial [Rhodospirillaceae bacterium]|nr:hypothetical protein [Rhodospirillaceae bacterium]
MIAVVAASGVLRSAQAELELSTVLAALPAGEVVPGGERYGAAAGTPLGAAVYRGDE